MTQIDNTNTLYIIIGLLLFSLIFQAVSMVFISAVILKFRFIEFFDLFLKIVEKHFANANEDEKRLYTVLKQNIKNIINHYQTKDQTKD